MSSSGEVGSNATTSILLNKKKRKKRKRISKHVLLAASSKSKQANTDVPALSLEEGAEGAREQGAPRNTTTGRESKKTRRANDSHVKDPSEALSYLQNWKEHRQHQKRGGGRDDDDSPLSSSWKFNKNTQSWLVRHMYEPDKVPKHAFELLVEYLEGMPEGSTTTTRISADARRRVLRYKQQIQTQNQEDGGLSHSGGNSAGDACDIMKNDKDRNKNDNVVGVNDDNDDEDETRWRQMSDHDQRKEYKRARRIVELYKGATTVTNVER